MTNAHSSMIRTARGLLAGLTIGVTVASLAAAPVATASADTGDYVLWQRQFGTTAAADLDHDSDVDAADYILWRKRDSTAVFGQPVTFTATVTPVG